MSWSLGEIQSLAIKACRGAGLDWGIAEEAGFAIRWLESIGLPGTATLHSYLDSRHSTPAADKRAACPLLAGTELLDHQRSHPIDLGLISHPLLLVPFLAAYAEMPCQLTWQNSQSDNSVAANATIHIARRMVGTFPANEKSVVIAAFCHTQYSSNAEWISASTTRVDDSNENAVRGLTNWARKTYAPMTEQSRLTGAGAGVSDND